MRNLDPYAFDKETVAALQKIKQRPGSYYALLKLAILTAGHLSVVAHEVAKLKKEVAHDPNT